MLKIFGRKKNVKKISKIVQILDMIFITEISRKKSDFFLEIFQNMFSIKNFQYFSMRFFLNHIYSSRRIQKNGFRANYSHLNVSISPSKNTFWFLWFWRIRPHRGFVNRTGSRQNTAKNNFLALYGGGIRCVLVHRNEIFQHRLWGYTFSEYFERVVWISGFSRKNPEIVLAILEVFKVVDWSRGLQKLFNWVSESARGGSGNHRCRPCGRSDSISKLYIMDLGIWGVDYKGEWCWISENSCEK